MPLLRRDLAAPASSRTVALPWLGLLAVLASFGCGHAAAVTAAPAPSASAPEPEKSTPSAAEPVEKRVTEVVYCRVLDRLVDNMSAELSAAARRPDLSPEEASALLLRLRPEGARDVIAAILQDEGFTGPDMAAFIDSDPAAVDRCLARFEGRFKELTAVAAPVFAAASRSSSGVALPWRADLPQAMKDARAQGKGVLLVFCAEWAGACHQLDRSTFQDPKVRAALSDRFIAARVDATNDEDAAVIKVRKAHLVKGIPELIVFDTAGREVRRSREYVDAAGLLKLLEAVPAAKGGATR
jgi:thioredoxin-related protein